MRPCKFLLCVMACCACQGLFMCHAYADSLRLPEENSPKTLPMPPSATEEIVTTPESSRKLPVLVVPQTNGEIVIDSEVSPTNPAVEPLSPLPVETPSSQLVVPVIQEAQEPMPDVNKPIETKNDEEEINLPKGEDKQQNNTDVNIPNDASEKEKSQIVPVIVQPAQQSPRSIEDILADPMKNKIDADKGDSLSIPEDTNKMDFIEGKWRCETDLINIETKEPLVMEFVFDKNGKGSGRVREKTGRVFTGSANATLKNGTLRVRVDKLATPNSKASYNGSEILCKQKDKIAVCKGKNTGTPAIEWENATFHRIK